MSALSSLGLAFYALVLLGAFAIRGAAGFGAGLIAVPLLAFVLPIQTAISLATALSAVTSVQQVGRDWRQIAWGQFLLLSFYTLIGIVVGFYFVSTLDEDALRQGLGVFLVFYSLYALWSAKGSFALPAAWRSTLAAGAGISGGFLSTLFGAGVGPIYVVYFNALRLSRDAFRVTMSTIVLLASAIRISGYANFGFYDHSTMILLAIGVPLVFVGSWLGDRFVDRFKPLTFSYLVGGLVFLSGVALLVK